MVLAITHRYFKYQCIYPDILSVLTGYYQRFTWIFPVFYPDVPSVWPKYGLPSKPFKPVN